MPLPRLSFPRFAPSGPSATMALYAGFTFVLFVVFLVVTFPYDVLVRRALSGLQGSPVVIDFQVARFAWHRGIALDGFELRLADAATPVPALEAASVWLRPAFGQLVRGNPYAIELQADLYGGTAAVDADLSAGRLVGTVSLDAISIGRYGPLASMLEEGRLGGRVDADFSFASTLAAVAAGQATGSVRLSQAALQEAKISGFGVPDIHLDDAKLDFALQNGRVDIAEFNAKGKEIIMSADGQISLRDPVADSVLNLRATIMPGPEAPDPIRGLLQLIPRPAGVAIDAPVRITGTIARPRVR